MELDIPTLLSAGSCLIDTKASQTSSHLKDVLQSRLVEFHRCLGNATCIADHDTLEQVQSDTAQQSLYVVEHIQRLLVEAPDGTSSRQPGGSDVTDRRPDEPSSNHAPLLGIRDLAQIRTLLSIVFKWGTDPILDRMTLAWSGRHSLQPSSSHEIIDLTSSTEDLHLFESFLSKLLNILFPSGAQKSVSNTLITNIILTRHIVDILKPTISLGWLPKSFTFGSLPSVQGYQQFVMRLLLILPPSETIAALGTILSHQPPPPRHVRQTCASLLSKQLVRPEGVRGLFDVIFGEVEGDHAPLDKLEQVSRVLCTVPSNMKPEVYFHDIVPRVINLLSDKNPNTHKRASAFVLSRMLVNNGSSPHHKLLSDLVLPMFHDPFLEVTLMPQEGDHDEGMDKVPPSGTPILARLTPSQSLLTILTVLTNTDPSPLLLSSLISPILPALYNALYYLDSRKASDPQLKETLRGVLETWGRVVNFQEAVDGLRIILANEGGEWEVDAVGELKRVVQASSLPPLSLLTPNDLKPGGRFSQDSLDLNLFDIRPDPIHFVNFIKSLGRSDVASDIFVGLLESYRIAKSDTDGNPMRTFQYLQIIMQMQEQASGTDRTFNIVNEPEHILLFANHVLDSDSTAWRDTKPQQDNRERSGFRLEDLRFISSEDSLTDEGDSEHEEPGVSHQHEMTETAINLVLAVLEAHPTLPTHSFPVLNDISVSLLRIANTVSHPVQKPAQEARLIITARLASASAPGPQKSTRTKKSEDSQTVYQRALKLLQDPVLPVRAHGLLLLRQLVSRKNGRGDVAIDQALVPAILSIFLQSVEHDDSYMFLNAVQGLAAMVDTFGKEVLKGLVDVYAKGLFGSAILSITKREVDTRLRVGEALGQVIRRCGDALTIYVDILVPPLLNVLRSSQVPTTLRTSSLSLLADCANTSVLSILPYSSDLLETMVDLLQVESEPMTEHTPGKQKCQSNQDKQAQETIDSQPTSANSKFPPLRRAALHFISLLIRATAAQPVDSTTILSSLPLKRVKLTLSYIASTDKDMIVRVMAREAVEELKTLDRTVVGL